MDGEKILCRVNRVCLLINFILWKTRKHFYAQSFYLELKIFISYAMHYFFQFGIKIMDVLA
jgi:hypothetical protein